LGEITEIPKSKIQIPKQIRNPNIEIRNPKQIPKRVPKMRSSRFGAADFGFVSDFDMRISDLFRIRILISIFEFRIFPSGKPNSFPVKDQVYGPTKHLGSCIGPSVT